MKGESTKKSIIRNSRNNRDIKIVKGIIKNYRPAYNKFIETYYKIIFEICFKSCYNIEDAEELCDDILVKIFNKMDSYDPEKGDFASWVYEITGNHLRDNVKKDDPENEISIERYSEEVNNEEYDDPEDRSGFGEKKNSSQDFFIKEQVAVYFQDICNDAPGPEDDPEVICLQNALNHISKRDQLILQYRAEGLDYTEIIEFLNIKYKTATTAYSRAVRKIKKEFLKNSGVKGE